MNDTSRIKHLSQVDVAGKNVTMKKPFKVESEGQRRFVRLEFSSPMTMQRVKDVFGGFWPTGQGEVCRGTILNISAGGLLVDLDSILNEGDVVLMSFTLQQTESLDNVLGLVKRTDTDDEGQLVGIEFIDRSMLSDKLSQAEMDMIGENCSDFKQTIEKVLVRFQRVSEGADV